MADNWTDRRPNPEFPACAQVARRLLAEVCGCGPGDQIPAKADLLARAREVAGEGDLTERFPGDIFEAAKARTALEMLEEIGGL